jgi:hypothetical protein
MASNYNTSNLKEILDRMPTDIKPDFEKILSTVALQAAIIDDLMWKLEIEESANAMKRQVYGQIITQLAAKLSSPIVKGPTLEEVKNEIEKMNKDIESATNAQNIFQTVLGFALKLAPLI